MPAEKVGQNFGPGGWGEGQPAASMGEVSEQ